MVKWKDNNGWRMTCLLTCHFMIQFWKVGKTKWWCNPTIRNKVISYTILDPIEGLIGEAKPYTTWEDFEKSWSPQHGTGPLTNWCLRMTLYQAASIPSCHGAMSGKWGQKTWQHLVNKGQEHYRTPHKAQETPLPLLHCSTTHTQQRSTQRNCSAEVEKLLIRKNGGISTL